jgi:6-phosphogluconolactonase
MVETGMSTLDMAFHLNEMESNQALVVCLADRIASNLDDALQERGSATLAVSGGSTPKPLFERLSEYPLDWRSISVTQVDERWVDESHEDSNALLIRRHLLRNAAADAEFVSMKTSAASPFQAQAEVSSKLSAFRDGIDVVVLGMGEDGHTASFFPGAATLQRAMDPASDELCIPVKPPRAPHERMTFTLAALLRARHLYLHITGESKWQVFQKATEPGSVEELPIRGFLAETEMLMEVFYASGD